MILTILVFLVTLLVLVLAHELGHFTVAKKYGVKILEFGFGIPPKIWGKKVGETIVSINLLPVGGFVRLLGEDETDKKTLQDKRSFAVQPVWHRILIVIAGVVSNFLLAVILFWVVLGAQGFKERIPLIIPFHFIGVNQTDETSIYIAGIAGNSPAQTAGIQVGERVTQFNGIDLKDSRQFTELTKEHAGGKVTLTLVSDPDKSSRQVQIVPRPNPPAGQGALGVELAALSVAELNYETPFQKATAGVVHSYNLASYSLNILGNLISTSVKTKNLEPVSQSVSGPVGLTNLTGEIVHTRSPFIPYLNFVALLSLNLAIINILPFPALDGGRLFFLALEAVLRRRIKPEVERWVNTVGMALLIALIVLVTFSDIRKLF